MSLDRPSAGGTGRHEEGCLPGLIGTLHYSVGLANMKLIDLRIRRLGVRIPSGAQGRKALDLQEQGSGAFALSSLVDGWVLGGCSCDGHPLRPAPSRW